uniref:Uncharacterized protein n=1 Tax=Opuntia streptacantha TaxID=393608 RepID=A0A7C9CK53_OPUST
MYVPEVSTVLQKNGAPKFPSRLEECTACEFCETRLFEHKTDNFCCQRGQIELATNPVPEELERLLTSKDEAAVHFRQFARMYNNLFAISSIRGNYDGKSVKRNMHSGFMVNCTTMCLMLYP